MKPAQLKIRDTRFPSSKKKSSTDGRIVLPAVEGCYFILCRETLKTYIGRSENVNRRVLSHIYDLKGGKHPISAMQSDFCRFGPQNFAAGIFFRADSPEGRELDREMILAKCAYVGAMESEIALYASRDTPMGTVSGPLLSEDRLYQIASPVYRRTNKEWQGWNADGWRGELIPGMFTPKLNKTLFLTVSAAVEAVTISSIPPEFLYNRDNFRSRNRGIMLHYLRTGNLFNALGKPITSTFAHEMYRKKNPDLEIPTRMYFFQDYFKGSKSKSA